MNDVLNTMSDGMVEAIKGLIVEQTARVRNTQNRPAVGDQDPSDRASDVYIAYCQADIPAMANSVPGVLECAIYRLDPSTYVPTFTGFTRVVNNLFASLIPNGSFFPIIKDKSGIWLVSGSKFSSVGGGGTTIEVKEVDGTPDYTSVSVLSFDQADGFVVTQPSAGQARVDLQDASGTVVGKVNITSQTFAGRKTFTSGITVSGGGGMIITTAGYIVAGGSIPSPTIYVGSASIGLEVDTTGGLEVFLKSYGTVSDPHFAIYGNSFSFAGLHTGKWGTDSVGNVFSGGLCTTVGAGGGGSVPWSSVTGTPTTLAGYGITNAYTNTTPLNSITAPTADVSLNSHKLTNVADPTNPQDAVTVHSIPSLLDGLGGASGTFGG